MSVTLNLEQARELVEFFGGADANVEVAELDTGHSGPGLYAWIAEEPQEGSVKLSDELDEPLSDNLWAWLNGTHGVGASSETQPKGGA